MAYRERREPIMQCTDRNPYSGDITDIRGDDADVRRDAI